MQFINRHTLNVPPSMKALRKQSRAMSFSCSWPAYYDFCTKTVSALFLLLPVLLRSMLCWCRAACMPKGGSSWNVPCFVRCCCKANSSGCPLRPRTTPFPDEKFILGVIYGVLRTVVCHECRDTLRDCFPPLARNWFIEVVASGRICIFYNHNPGTGEFLRPCRQVGVGKMYTATYYRHLLCGAFLRGPPCSTMPHPLQHAGTTRGHPTPTTHILLRSASSGATVQTRMLHGTPKWAVWLRSLKLLPLACLS